MGTWNREPLLANSGTNAAFVAHAESLKQRNIAIGRYVLMPDHAHFFVRIGRGEKLGLTIKHVKESVTKQLRKLDPQLRVWQPGFFDHLLRHSESYGEKWQYVRSNPVRAGLVDRPDDWPFQGEITLIDRA